MNRRRSLSSCVYYISIPPFLYCQGLLGLELGKFRALCCCPLWWDTKAAVLTIPSALIIIAQITFRVIKYLKNLGWCSILFSSRIFRRSLWSCSILCFCSSAASIFPSSSNLQCNNDWRAKHHWHISSHGWNLKLSMHKPRFSGEKEFWPTAKYSRISTSSNEVARKWQINRKQLVKWFQNWRV